MKKLTYSIVIPTLNEEKYLPKLLTDLAVQSYKDFEVIVCDGKSEDRTRQKAEEFINKIEITVIQSSKRNVSYQRNYGSKKATGDWLIFMDADTRVPKGFMKNINSQLVLNPTIDVFTTWAITDSNHPADRAIAVYLNLGMELLKVGNYPAALGALIGIRKEAFKDVRGFSLDCPYGEDAELIRRVTKKQYNFAIFRKPKFTYSLRRVKKLGRLEYISKTTYLNLKTVFKLKIDQKKEYPMGGEIENIKTQDLFKRLQLTPKNFKKSDFYLKLNKLLKSLREE